MVVWVIRQRSRRRHTRSEEGSNKVAQINIIEGILTQFHISSFQDGDKESDVPFYDEIQDVWKFPALCRF